MLLNSNAEEWIAEQKDVLRQLDSACWLIDKKRLHKVTRELFLDDNHVYMYCDCGILLLIFV